MKRAILLALVLLGCGEGGGGEAQAPTEAPLCEPPELTCEHPQRHDDTPTRYMLACGETDEDFAMVEYLNGKVYRYQQPAGVVASCWPSATVATLDQPNAPTACYDQDGARADCERISGGELAAAWGLTPPNP